MSISKLDLLSVPPAAKTAHSAAPSVPFYALIKHDAHEGTMTATREAHVAGSAENRNQTAGTRPDRPITSATAPEYRLADYADSKRLAAQVKSDPVAAASEDKLAAASSSTAATTVPGAAAPTAANIADVGAALAATVPSAATVTPTPGSPVIATDEAAVWTALATGNSAGIPREVINTYGSGGLLYDPAKIMDAYRASPMGQAQMASIAWIGKV